MITDCDTARIIFVYEFGALTHEEHAPKHHIIFNGPTTNVALMPTPTWPIKHNHRRSRCLEFQRFPRWVMLPGFWKVIGGDPDPSLHTKKRNGGPLTLQLSSIERTCHAHELSARISCGCKAYFIPTPTLSLWRLCFLSLRQFQHCHRSIDAPKAIVPVFCGQSPKDDVRTGSSFR